MNNVKLIFILLFGHILMAVAEINYNFPIGGLFNKETQPDSLKAYTNTVEMMKQRKKQTSYHGEPIVPEAVDAYSTALAADDVYWLLAYNKHAVYHVSWFSRVHWSPHQAIYIEYKLTSHYTGSLYNDRNSSQEPLIALIDARPTHGVCDATCLLCNRLNISHLSLGWQLPETSQEDLFTFSYHPSSEMISKAFAALIKDLQWDKFTFLYEDDDSFLRMQEVINTWPIDREPILYRRLDPEGDNKETFKYIFKVAKMSYHLLDCNVKNIKKYFNEIVKVENSTQYQSFILSALDAYQMNFEDLKEWGGNISTLHLTTTNGMERWRDIDMDGSVISLETALTADALNHLEKGIRKMTSPNAGEDYEDDERRQFYLATPPKLCFSERVESAWVVGEKLRESLLNTKITGFTGDIEFDEYGKRTNLRIYYSKLNDEAKFNYVGHWESNTDIVTTTNEVLDRSAARKPDSVIQVVSIKNKPYLMVDNSKGTEEYIGYAVDLINLIFDKINKEENTEYKTHIYAASGLGNPIEGTRKWSGLMGELMEHKAELGICDLTVTSERARVVDFSIPFMSLGISMLFRDPEPEAPDMFSFIKPLDLDVWLYLATTYIIVSFILLICARSSQDDWVNPHPCNQNPENLQNIWTLYNCMWLTMGSIMTQGCDILPRAACSRWITGVWWFFVLIFTASYTANMSTFLSNSRRSNEINDVKALSEQNKVSYGAVFNASTYKFFETSNDTVYSKIWTVMSSAKPTVFTNNNEEGKDRVMRSKGKYAFFMESTAIEYYTKRNCTLKMVGGKLDSKDYGIAMPKRSPWKSKIDKAILELQESGRLDTLKKEWWVDKSVNCENPANTEDDSGSLEMKNTSGIFLVLGVGGITGLFVAIIDFMIHANKIAVKEKVTFREALISEWRASLDPRMLHKPAAPPRSAAPSTRSATPVRDRSQSRAVSVLRAATSFINFDEIY